jgi:hypothetical protein
MYGEDDGYTAAGGGGNQHGAAAGVARAVIIEPNENDVILGRGRAFDTHPGNVMFQVLVMQHTDRYNSVESKLLKTQIANFVVQEVCNSNGRFLRMNRETGLWEEVDDNTARIKASQALRYRFRRQAEYGSEGQFIEPDPPANPAVQYQAQPSQPGFQQQQQQQLQQQQHSSPQVTKKRAKQVKPAKQHLLSDYDVLARLGYNPNAVEAAAVAMMANQQPSGVEQRHNRSYYDLPQHGHAALMEYRQSLAYLRGLPDVSQLDVFDIALDDDSEIDSAFVDDLCDIARSSSSESLSRGPSDPNKRQRHT